MVPGTPSAVLLSSCTSRGTDHKCISGNVICSTCQVQCSDYTAINISRFVKFETYVHDSTTKAHYHATFTQMGDKTCRIFLWFVRYSAMSFFFWGGCKGTFRGKRQFLLPACGADPQFRISLHVFAVYINCSPVYFYLIF